MTILNSSDSQKKLLYFFSVIGLIDSAYLTWIKLAEKQAACSGIGECDIVNASTYAEIFGIPIALLGLFAYLSIIFFVYAEEKYSQFSESSVLFVFGVSLVGLLYSIYLTYIEIEVLNAICPFCVISAVIMIVLFIISVMRLRVKYLD